MPDPSPASVVTIVDRLDAPAGREAILLGSQFRFKTPELREAMLAYLEKTGGDLGLTPIYDLFRTDGRILVEGDSLSNLGVDAPAGEDGAVFNLLALLPNGSRFAIHGYAVNASVSAYLDGRYLAGPYLQRQQSPDELVWFFLGIGSNDAASAVAVATYKATVAAYLTRLIGDGQDPAHIVIELIMPRIDTAKSVRLAYVTAQLELAVQFGTKVSDWGAVLPDPMAFPDGTHPDAALNARIALRLEALLAGGPDDYIAAVNAVAAAMLDVPGYLTSNRGFMARGFVSLDSDVTGAGKGALSSEGSAIGTGGFTAWGFIRPRSAGLTPGGFMQIAGGSWLMLQNQYDGIVPLIFDGTTKAPVLPQVCPFGETSFVCFRRSNSGHLIDICVNGNWSPTINDAITTYTGGIKALGVYDEGGGTKSLNLDFAAFGFHNAALTDAQVAEIMRTGGMPSFSMLGAEVWVPLITGGLVQKDYSTNARTVTFASPSRSIALPNNQVTGGLLTISGGVSQNGILFKGLGGSHDFYVYSGNHSFGSGVGFCLYDVTRSYPILSVDAPTGAVQFAAVATFVDGLKLPVADPHVADVLYNAAGTPTFSAG